MKKRPISDEKPTLWISESGHVVKFPQKLLKEIDRYQVNDKRLINRITRKLQAQFGYSPKDLFQEINDQHTEPGAFLKGLRYREGLNQTEFAKLIDVKQGDLSKMENGKRPIGKTLAKKIAALFDINYQNLL